MSLCVPVQKKCQRECRRATLGVERTRRPEGASTRPISAMTGMYVGRCSATSQRITRSKAALRVGQGARQIDVGVDRDAGRRRRRVGEVSGGKPANL